MTEMPRRYFAAVSIADSIRISGEYKKLADACKVHVRRVYKWATAEAAIPDHHAETIYQTLGHIPGGTAPILREIADLLDQHAQAVEDGKVSVLEAAAVREQIQRAMFRMELEAREMERKAGT